ncbi:MAG: hypothetical protein ACE5EV_04860, partial [Gaiellales bacterium]
MIGVALTLAACGGSGSPADQTGAPDSPPPAGLDDASRFVGLGATEAADLADAESRPWRIAREDDEFFALTQDLVMGRVTFEIDDGVVTVATIEGDAGAAAPEQPEAERQLAMLLAAATTRILTVDNGFGEGSDPFDVVEVGDKVGSDPSQPVPALARDLVRAGVASTASVAFVADPQSRIERYFEEMRQGTAVVTIDAARIAD